MRPTLITANVVSTGGEIAVLNYALMPFRKYAQFQGRSRRAEYWWYTLLVVVVSIVLAGIDMAMLGASAGSPGMLGLIWAAATFIPSIAVGVRRLHDTNRSGFWLLIAFIPLIGAIVLLVFFVMDGTPGENKFGPSPKLNVNDTF